MFYWLSTAAAESTLNAAKAEATITAQLDGVGASISAEWRSEAQVSAPLDGVGGSIAVEWKAQADVVAPLDGISASIAAEWKAEAGIVAALDGVSANIAAEARPPAQAQVVAALDGVSAALTVFHPDNTQQADYHIPRDGIAVEADYVRPQADVDVAGTSAIPRYQRIVAEVSYQSPVVVRVYLDHRGKMLSFHDFVTVDDEVAFGFGAVLNDSVTASDQAVFGHAFTLDDSVVAADNLTLTTEFNLQFDDSVTAADGGIVLDFGAVLDDSVTVSDSLDIVLEIGYDHLINGEEINVATIN